MARAKHCTWRGTAARGVYKPACAIAKVLGIPPRPGAECPGCGRPVVHYRPKAKPASLKDFRKWQKRNADSASPTQETK